MAQQIPGRGRHALALLGFALLTLVITWPLAANLTTHVIGPERADNYEYVWKMWWLPHALTEGLPPFVIPEIYHPFGYALAYGELTPLHTVFLSPLTLLIGELATYNLIMLVSCALSGWLCYLLAWRWLCGLADDTPGLRFAAAVTAGAAFAFSGYRMTRIAYHLPLADTQWVLLALLALDLWLESRRARHLILLGAAFALAALSSWYYAFMLALILPVYALAYAGLRGLLREFGRRRTWVGAIAAAALVIVLCGPFLLPYLQLGAQAVVPAEDVAFWSASPLDYLMPNARHPLWGAAASRLQWPFPGQLSQVPWEFIVTSGLIVLLFALLALRQTRGPRWRALKWMTGVGFVLSLGPILHLSRLPLNIPLPAALVRVILPTADSVRTWGRFSLFVLIGLCLLAGAGIVRWLRARPRRIQHVAGAGIAVLVVFETWVGPIGLVPVEPRPVDRWLAEQPGQVAIMQYPIFVALSGPQMLYTRYHGKRIVFGYGTYLPLTYRQRHPELLTFPADAALDTLREWGVHFVLIQTDALDSPLSEPFTLADVTAQPRLRHVATLENQAVYELLR